MSTPSNLRENAVKQRTNGTQLAPNLTTFEGYIRSLDSTSVDPQSLSHLKDIFPTFFDVDRPEIQIDPETLEPMLRYARIERPPRRFAGHFDRTSFPRGRYYSVAHDAEGNDHGTLARELLAYSSSRRQVLVADMRAPDDARCLEQHGFKTTMTDSLAVLLDPTSRSSTTIIEIPLLTRKVTIAGCLDLRQQRTQEWFQLQFRHGTDQLLFVPGAGSAVQTFTDMLPGLMWPSLGGGDIQEAGSITRAVGSWMRTNHVSALIFPSARSDSSVRYKSGTMVEFYGWNLVDYRGTWDEAYLLGPNPILTCSVAGWPSGLPYRCALHVDESGSWQISGPENYLLEKFYPRRPESGHQ